MTADPPMARCMRGARRRSAAPVSACRSAVGRLCGVAAVDVRAVLRRGRGRRCGSRSLRGVNGIGRAARGGLVGPLTAAIPEEASQRTKTEDEQRLDEQTPNEERKLCELATDVPPTIAGAHGPAPVLGERADPPDVADISAGQQLGGDRAGDANRAERIVDEDRPTVGDVGAPAADVFARRSVPVRSVDVQHVDWLHDLERGLLGGEPDVSDTVADAGLLEVGKERLVVSLTFVRAAADLLWTTVVASMRVNGDDLDTRRRGASEDDR